MSKGKTNEGAKKEFAPSIGFWPAKSGNGFTVAVSDSLFDTLMKVQPGGRLLLQEVPESVREGNEKAPHYRVIIFAPDEKVKSASGDSI